MMTHKLNLNLSSDNEVQLDFTSLPTVADVHELIAELLERRKGCSPCDQSGAAYLANETGRLCKVWYWFYDWNRAFAEPEFESNWKQFHEPCLHLELGNGRRLEVQYVGSAVRGLFRVLPSEQLL